VARSTDYWRAMLGAIILLLVLLFPQGIAGSIKLMVDRWRDRSDKKSATGRVEVKTS
jgi:branched-chain amino acid transport system permease protein